MAKGQNTHPEADAVIFTTERGAKSWHGRAVKSPNQRKCLLDGCGDWEVSADLPEWESHPRIIKETRLRPDIVIHSSSTQQLIMVELTVPYESRMEEAHTYKREKYLNLTKIIAKKCPLQSRCNARRGWCQRVHRSLRSPNQTVNMWQQKNESSKVILAEIAENSSRWIWSRRNERSLYKD